MIDQNTTFQLTRYSLEQTRSLVFWLNVDHQIVYCNQIGQLTDTQVDSWGGIRFEALASLYDELEWSDILDGAIPVEGVICEGSLNEAVLRSLRQPSQESLTVDYQSQATRFHLTKQEIDHQVFFIVSCVDLTTDKEREAAREKADDLSKAMREIEKINSDLASAAQAKDEFLASMSHELRTPLNAVMGLCEALLEGVYGPLGADQHQPIRQIFSNGHHLLSVISDILDLSKLRAGGISLSLSDIDVEACCFEAIQVFRSEMQKKRLSINVNIEGVYLLNADERWFKQVLMNLLSNAVKFTPSDNRVGLSVTESPDIGYLRVTVWDEGIGIEEEDIPRLFQTFVQLDNSLARAYEGTGLGLSIVSSVMQLHGGKIHVESKRGKGSKFHLEFPWIPEKQSFIKEQLTPTAHSLNSVLIVEDSELDANRIIRFLDELDAEVFWDQRGSEMFELAKKHRPDLIILDLFLPESSGWELLKQIKADETLSHIPVVISSVLEKDNRKPEMSYVAAYLQKPFSRNALKRCVKEAQLKIKSLADSTLEPSVLFVTAQEVKSHKQAERQKLYQVLDATPTEDVLIKPRILIVDDNQSNIQLVNDYLSRKGCNIYTAEDGYQAVQVARAHLPDLILMDIQMPHMDGIEATGHIKGDPKIKNIPIFALTALAMPGDRERCLEAGMEDYFTKPVSLRALYKRIKERLTS